MQIPSSNIRFRIALAAFAALGAACGGGNEAAFGGGGNEPVAIERTANSSSPICNALESYLSSDASAAGKVQGYSFALFDGARILLTCAGGDQTMAAIRPIASASKLPAAAAIMTLVDSSQLNLDVPVSRYLLGSGVNWPLDKIRITTRMLLAHTSGLAGEGPGDAPTACLDDATGTTLKDCVAQIAAAPLVATPGEVFNYGGADYQVAGFIATRIASQSWQDFFNSRIGAPLGLNTFSYGDPAHLTNPRVAGGAISNVADYVTILQMILNNGQAGGAAVLSASSVATLETDQIAGKPLQYTPLDPSLYPGYTFGFFISADSLHPDSAGPEFSGPGLFGATPWIDTNLGYGAVLLIDKNTPTGVAMWNAVRPLIVAALKTP